MNAETALMNRILAGLSAEFHPHGIFWRQNAGRIRSDRGAWVSLGPPGIADIVGVVDGRAVFVEVKTKKGRQRKAQAAFQAAAEKAGAVYVVARSPDDAVSAVRAASTSSSTTSGSGR
ncbi:VRR-NUC domain-containing protein [Rhodovulum sp. 12E13]|uniref:VRR-NUC domain-containing protein n=1 Tax=Rhodovulum sp. 12E13 TaxID=2203891 RepID=UPI000E18025F|nr:VRR-NUC domain-containing protein [Rhodovulum sp. 12E13]RDC68082.1 VRR-NUC domain-containing protein [Rhodovulum sp. 12E13]